MRFIFFATRVCGARYLAICLLGLVLLTTTAKAATTIYSDRAAFLEVVGSTRVVDFSTDDSGNPITDPPSDAHFPYLGLRGLCFQNVRSYYDLSIYTFPNATIRVDLPAGTYAAGTDLSPFYTLPGTYTITLSTGEAFQVNNANVPWVWDFFGVVSDVPIEWISFSFNNTYIVLDGFTVSASIGSVAGCPSPSDSAGPQTSDVTLAPNPVAVQTSVSLAATVDESQTGGNNIASAEYAVAGGAFAPMAGSFNASATTAVSAVLPAFASAGVFDVCVRGADTAGNVGELSCVPLPVYDPSAGFVTGGGWILSPEGAYAPDPSLTGKATFGFVSTYVNGASVPSGNTQFVFHAAKLQFKSSAYEWMVIAGARVQYKGRGTINGVGNYQFLLTAIDGDRLGSDQPDRLRLKIFNDEGIVYDNQVNAGDGEDPQTQLGGGNIVLHR